MHVANPFRGNANVFGQVFKQCAKAARNAYRQTLGNLVICEWPASRRQFAGCV
ncbi:MAG: hypothetical protein ABI363_06415 [Nitrosospira sp.]